MSHTKRTPVEQDWRFAELIARVWMEPGLGDRYAADPCTVLAEFGLDVTRPEDAPDLAPYCGQDLIIEDVEHARGYRLAGTACFCTTGGDTDQPNPDPKPAPAPARDR
jgi:hypothetical protein